MGERPRRIPWFTGGFIAGFASCALIAGVLAAYEWGERHWSNAYTRRIVDRLEGGDVSLGDSHDFGAPVWSGGSRRDETGALCVSYQYRSADQVLTLYERDHKLIGASTIDWRERGRGSPFDRERWYFADPQQMTLYLRAAAEQASP